MEATLHAHWDIYGTFCIVPSDSDANAMLEALRKINEDWAKHDASEGHVRPLDVCFYFIVPRASDSSSIDIQATFCQTTLGDCRPSPSCIAPRSPAACHCTRSDPLSPGRGCTANVVDHLDVLDCCRRPSLFSVAAPCTSRSIHCSECSFRL